MSTSHRRAPTLQVLWLLAGLTIALTLPAVPLARAAGLALVTDTNLGGMIADVAVAGDRAILAEGAGITVLDLSNPSAPVRRAMLPMPAAVSGIAVAETWAAATMDHAGLQIIDLGDPAAPHERGRYVPPPRSGAVVRVTAVALDGHLAYVLVAVESAGYVAGGQLQIIDLGDLDHPALLGAVATSGWPVAVQLRNGVAYVASRSTPRITGGLEIFRVAKPATPTRIGFVADTAYGGYGIEVANGIAYVGRVGVFDVRDPTAPRRTAPLLADVLRVNGGYAYAFDKTNNMMEILDLADPSVPRILAKVSPLASGEGWLRPVTALQVSSDRLYLTTEDDLRLFSLSDPAQPARLGRLDGGRFNTVLSDGGQVYADGARIWLPAPGAPGLAPTVGLAGQATPRLLGVAAGRAYLTSGNGKLLIANLADPAAPPLGELPLPADPSSSGMRPGTSVNGLAVADGLLYLSVQHLGSHGQASNEMVIVDAHDPQAPRVLGRVAGDVRVGAAGAVVVVAGRAYVTQGTNNLAIFDVHNPAAPVVAGLLGGLPANSSALATSDGWLYVGGENALTVVDARDPAAPALRATVKLSGTVRALARGGGRIYAGIDANLTILSADDPALPRIIISAPLPDKVEAVALVGERIFVALGYAGLRVFHVTDAAANPSPPADARCFPETGQCISGPIRTFWERNGGLPVFGYPITAQGPAQIEGQMVDSQWFERNRLELHPKNAPPYNVLIGRVGADALARQGRDWRAASPAVSTARCRFFRETGRNICGAFLARWRSSGLELDGRPGVSEAESLALFGLPLTDPQTETLSDGRGYSVQWFERARLELHPELGPQVVLLGLLGRELNDGGGQ